MAMYIDGKAIAAALRRELKEETAALRSAGIVPALAVILVGDDPASQVYVRNKKRACEEIGIYSEEYHLPAATRERDLLDLICTLNERPELDGILCQLPLPQPLSDRAVIAAIDPAKDVDAFHAFNVGHIVSGDYTFLPCTPAGVMELLHRSGVTVEGKHCVVVGRSNIVGKPMALLLLHENGTVTVCHSKTPDLAEVCRTADILVSAVGRAGLITADMVKPGAVVIDVGMNRDAEGRLCGDVDTASVAEVASMITPVPGGVGPMTIAMLMKNTVTAAGRRAAAAQSRPKP